METYGILPHAKRFRFGKMVLLTLSNLVRHQQPCKDWRVLQNMIFEENGNIYVWRIMYNLKAAAFASDFMWFRGFYGEVFPNDGLSGEPPLNKSVFLWKEIEKTRQFSVCTHMRVGPPRQRRGGGSAKESLPHAARN